VLPSGARVRLAAIPRRSDPNAIGQLYRYAATQYLISTPLPHVAKAAGERHMIASTGSTSEKSANEMYNLPDYALLDMGDFAGGVLKYLKKHGKSFLKINQNLT